MDCWPRFNGQALLHTQLAACLVYSPTFCCGPGITRRDRAIRNYPSKVADHVKLFNHFLFQQSQLPQVQSSGQMISLLHLFFDRTNTSRWHVSSFIMMTILNSAIFNCNFPFVWSLNNVHNTLSPEEDSQDKSKISHTPVRNILMDYKFSYNKNP